MKAKIRKTGEIVEVTRNIYGVYVDENCVGYNLKDLIFDYEEDEHWQDVRERAAITAMQKTLDMITHDYQTYRNVVVEGYRGSKGTCPNIIADFAVACANALVEQLKKERK